MHFFKEKIIPYYYLYDDLGSDLFDQITLLPEYYPFKKEEEILISNIDKMLEFTDNLKTEKFTLIEFGAGYSKKTEIIIKKLLEKNMLKEFIPIDISEAACNLTLETYKNLIKVRPFIGTYDQFVQENISFENRVIYIWLGSSIGNFTYNEQVVFLSKVSKILNFRDVLFIGFDTVYKSREIIKLAYNDSKGITAKFILNVLKNIKNKFDLQLNEEDFEYYVNYNTVEERVEMYIKAKKNTLISYKEDVLNNKLSKSEELILENEKIFVEYSHKFSLEKISLLGHSANLMLKNTWFSDDKYFMFSLFLKDVNNCVWKKTEEIFRDFIKYENLNVQPINLRNKYIFYLGHLYNFYDIRVLDLQKSTPFFALFERGRDPEVENKGHCHRHSSIENVTYPHYDEILAYNENIKKTILEKIKNDGYTFKVLASIEHEIMHQETLFYMIRMSNFTKFHISLPIKFVLPEKNKINIPKRKILQGSNETFCWDNESPQHEIFVDSFSVDNFPITWGEMKEFIIDNLEFSLNKNIINRGKTHIEHKENENIETSKEIELNENNGTFVDISDALERDIDNNSIKNNCHENIFSVLSNPNINENMQIRINGENFIDFSEAENLPAWVNLEMALEFVNWKNKKGIKCRLMTEEEFDSLASNLKTLKNGNINYNNLHAMPIGYYQDCSDDGVYELFSNGWELTSSLFRPFKGFQPLSIYDEYSQDFFTDFHYVLKGASPFTNETIIRKSFRNWYQKKYPYHIAKFRLTYG